MHVNVPVAMVVAYLIGDVLTAQPSAPAWYDRTARLRQPGATNVRTAAAAQCAGVPRRR
jgi:hypothetical protein